MLMKRIVILAAASAFGVALSAPASAADAGHRVASPLSILAEELAPASEYAAYRRDRGRRAYRGRRNAAGAAVAAGVAGAVIGGAIAAQSRPRSYDRGYGYDGRGYDRPSGNGYYRY